MANLNHLKRTGERSKNRVGRGGKRGKTSGRGTKGQSARAGNKKRPEMRDIIKKLPKRRGYGKNRSRTVDGSAPAPIAIPLSRLEQIFDSGAEVNPKAFFEKGIVKGRGFNFPMIKIVGDASSELGTSGLTKSLIFTGVGVSKSAKAAIEKAGGSVTLLPQKKVKRVHAKPVKSAGKAAGKPAGKKKDK